MEAGVTLLLGEERKVAETIECVSQKDLSINLDILLFLLLFSLC